MVSKPLYSRVITAKTPSGTQIPDMDDAFSAAPASNGKEAKKVTNPMVSSEPVVGFLYSVSRSLAGEYWPLHLGENTIGRDSNNDIVLSEMTVSSFHATLNIRRMKTTKEYLVDLSVRGVNGGFVNDQEVRKEAECKNGDFLTIGDNYVLYLILVNPFILGMGKAENFVPAEEIDSNQDFDSRFEQDFDRTSGGSMYDSRRRPSGGTEGMEGSEPDPQEGFTSHLL